MSKEEDFESQYTTLEKPEFESKIPPHLVSNLSESERFLVSSISKIEQKCDWLIESILLHNKAILEIDVRIKRIETWRNNIMSKWGLIGGAVILFTTAAATAWIENLVKGWIGGH